MYFERRTCDFTSQPIAAKDRASVQLLFAKLGPNGRMIDGTEIVDVCGSVRKDGLADALLYERMMRSFE